MRNTIYLIRISPFGWKYLHFIKICWDPWIKKRLNYLSCMEGKGVWKTFAVYHNSTLQLFLYCKISFVDINILSEHNLNLFLVSMRWWCIIPQADGISGDLVLVSGHEVQHSLGMITIINRELVERPFSWWFCVQKVEIFWNESYVFSWSYVAQVSFK